MAEQLPDCMMPDGADPCEAYKKLQEKNQKLCAQLAIYTGTGCKFCINCEEIGRERDEFERLAKSWMNDYDRLKNKYEPMEIELSELQEHQHVYNKNRKDLLAANEQLRAKLDLAVETLDRIKPVLLTGDQNV